jgi:hypothetical protein
MLAGRERVFDRLDILGGKKKKNEKEKKEEH